MSPSGIRQMISSALVSVRQALKGKVTRATGAKQVIQVQAEGFNGEPFNNTPFYQLPGYRGMPVAGMQPIIIPLNGKSANSVVIAMSNGKLFVADLQNGECMLFNENDGVANSLILRNGKVAELTTDTFNVKAAVAVNFDTPRVTMNHVLEVADDITTDGDVVAGTVSLKHHKNTGVQSGGSLSGEPAQ